MKRCVARRPRDAVPLALWTCALAAAVCGVHGGYADYGADVGLPLPLNGDSRTGAVAPEQELRAGARRHSASSGYGSTPLQAGAAQGLWHENQQIQWNPARLFRPDESLSFQYIKAGGVDLHFLDHTHLEGFDAQELVSIGPFTVETRLGLITRCNKPLCHRVDGILGFGWLDHDRSPCLFKTLTQASREDWGITQPFEFRPMPRIFSLTASDSEAELQLGGYDPESIEGEVVWVPMSKHQDYGASVASITYGDGEDAVELLQFTGQEPGQHKLGYIGKFDSGTTCILMPNTTLNGQLEESPFEKLLKLQLHGEKRALYYTFIDEQHRPVRLEIEYEHCVEPTSYRMILGDPFFKKYVVVHDMQDMNAKRMGLGLRKKSYNLAETGDNDYLGAFAYDQDIPNIPDPADAAHEHENKAAAMAALKEAAITERKELSSPQQFMREQGGKGKTSPFKIKVNRHVSNSETEGSLSQMRSSALREVRGPVLERMSTAAGEASPKSLDDVDDLEVSPSGEPWREAADQLETDEQKDVMSNSVNKVRLHSDNHIVYTVDLGVGTPPQKRTVVFDTGSYVLGVFSHEPPENVEPLLKDDTMVSAAENDLRKKYHVLDLQRSTREMGVWVWGAGEGGVAGMLVVGACGALALAVTVLAVVGRRGARRRAAWGWSTSPESQPLNP